MDNYNDQLTNEGGKNTNLKYSIAIHTQNVVHKKPIEWIVLENLNLEIQCKCVYHQ